MMRVVERAAEAVWNCELLLSFEECLAAAEAVFKAIREPSLTMLASVDDQDSDRMVARGRAVDAWQAMIDAALKERA